MQRITAREPHGGCAPRERRRKPAGGLAKPPFLVAEKAGKPLASKRLEWNNLPIPVRARLGPFIFESPAPEASGKLDLSE